MLNDVQEVPCHRFTVQVGVCFGGHTFIIPMRDIGLNQEHTPTDDGQYFKNMHIHGRFDSEM